MSDSDEQLRQASRQAIRRQLMLTLPLVVILGGVMVVVDAATGHPTLAVVWGACFALALGVVTLVAVRR